jgi:hypothetical protein
VFALALAPGFKIGLAAAILASLAWQWRRGTLPPPGVCRIGEDGQVGLAALGPRGGRVTAAALYPGGVRLTLADDTGRGHLLLVMQDAVAPEAYRELRARIAQQRLPVRDAPAL